MLGLNEATSNENNNNLLKKNVGKIKDSREFGLIIAVLVLGLVLTILTEDFLTSSNLINVTRQISITAVTAVGMTMVIITAGIDLSVGSIVAFTGVIAASVFSVTDSSILAILAGLGTGAVIGSLNGVITAKGKINGFITTIATMNIIRGLGYIYTGGYPISAFSNKFTFLGTGYVGVIPVPVIIMVIILLGGYFILEHTRLGRYIFSLGGNEQATKWSGINTDKIKMAVYSINGLLAGLSGIILAGRLASGQPRAGQGFELDVIAGAIVGGTSLAGGKGSILGTFIGVLLIGIITNGLTLLNVSSYYQMVIKGLIILFAVLLDIRTNS